MMRSVTCWIVGSLVLKPIAPGVLRVADGPIGFVWAWYVSLMWLTFVLSAMPNTLRHACSPHAFIPQAYSFMCHVYIFMPFLSEEEGYIAITFSSVSSVHLSIVHGFFKNALAGHLKFIP